MLAQCVLLLCAAPVFAATEPACFDIAKLAPAEAVKLHKAPVAFSFEFSSFPQYFVNTSQTWACLSTLKDVTGAWPSIRLGGTSQDQSLYDPTLEASIVEVSESSWHFGKRFIELAAKYKGPVVLGLNRGAGNLTNTIDAVKFAEESMSNLHAIELGNEPVLFPYLGFPVVPNGSDWNYATEAASESHWQAAVGSAFPEQAIIRAGNFVLPYFNSSLLFANEDASSLQFVRDYAHHHYPQTVANTTIVPPPDLRSLMSHVNVSAYVDSFQGDIAAAREWGFNFMFGETNSVSGGGSPVISPTFGDALWVLDHSLRSASSNVSQLHFHQGTQGESFYVWWTPEGVRSPFYGGYLAAKAMAGGSYIVSLDKGTNNFAGFVVYSASSQPLRVVLINSNFYDGTSERSTQSFKLQGLVGEEVKATRLTAANVWSRQDQGDSPTLGGRSFSDETCELVGNEMTESVEVVDGAAVFSVAASEALLIEL